MHCIATFLVFESGLAMGVTDQQEIPIHPMDIKPPLVISVVPNSHLHFLQGL
jgi:hypothetical protein